MMDIKGIISIYINFIKSEINDLIVSDVIANYYVNSNHCTYSVDIYEHDMTLNCEMVFSSDHVKLLRYKYCNQIPTFNKCYDRHEQRIGRAAFHYSDPNSFDKIIDYLKS